MNAWDNRTLIEDLVAHGVDDWVDDGWVWGNLAGRSAMSPGDRLPIALGAITVALLDGLVVAGDVMGGFQPWPMSPAESATVIAERWLAPDDPAVRPGDICWLSNTAAGDAMGGEFSPARPADSGCPAFA